MTNELKFSAVVLHRPMRYGRETGEEYAAITLTTQGGTLRRAPLSRMQLVKLIRDAATVLQRLEGARDV